MIKTIILSESDTKHLNKLIQDKEGIGYEVVATHIKQSLVKTIPSEIVVIMEKTSILGMD
tara:strand:+ start:30 stop:209 length:180 start_codon:yes stop_codon:yes gene_type:complete